MAVDGQPGPTYDDVSCPVVSPDRKHIAYIACKGRGEGRKQVPVIDGKEGPEYDEIALPSSARWDVFSPDGAHTTYAARLGAKWRVMTDGQAGAEYDRVAADSLAFSPDSRHVAYAAKSGPKWRVLLDGQPGPEYDLIGEGPILFLADGKGVGYAALMGQQWIVVSGDKPGARYDEVAGLTLTATRSTLSMLPGMAPGGGPSSMARSPRNMTKSALRATTGSGFRTTGDAWPMRPDRARSGAWSWTARPARNAMRSRKPWGSPYSVPVVNTRRTWPGPGRNGLWSSTAKRGPPSTKSGQARLSSAPMESEPPMPPGGRASG